jgi:hypothetical protein
MPQAQKSTHGGCAVFPTSRPLVAPSTAPLSPATQIANARAAALLAASIAPRSRHETEHQWAEFAAYEIRMALNAASATPTMSVSDVFLARDCVRAIRAAMIDSKRWDERAIDFIVEVIRTARAP